MKRKQDFCRIEMLCLSGVVYLDVFYSFRPSSCCMYHIHVEVQVFSQQIYTHWLIVVVVGLLSGVLFCSISLRTKRKVSERERYSERKEKEKIIKGKNRATLTASLYVLTHFIYYYN